MEKALFLILLTGLIAGSCHKNDDQSCQPIPETQCVEEEEEITSTETGFMIFSEGLQEEGYTTGLKINEEWKASASFYFFYDSIVSVSLKTYWTDTIDPNYFLLAEILNFKTPPTLKENGCYSLSSENNTQDSIRCRYRVNHGDVNILIPIRSHSRKQA